jgi:hypothetical protein
LLKQVMKYERHLQVQEDDLLLLAV